MSSFFKKFGRKRQADQPDREPAGETVSSGKRSGRSASPGVYVEERAQQLRPIEGVRTSVTAFVGRARKGPVNRPSLLFGFGEFDSIFGGLWEESPLSFAVRHYFQNGGRYAVVVRVGDDGVSVGDAELRGEPDAATGIYALDQAEIFNLLCLPPIAFGEKPSLDTLAAAADYCERRRALLLIDAPATAPEPTDVSSWAAGLSGLARKNAAVFYPRVLAPNPLRDGQVEAFAPAGAVAGVFARTDAAHGIWKAPAGRDATLRGVRGLSYDVDDRENNQLNRLGINCLRSLGDEGPVIWGARTLEGADGLSSDWKYIPVARLALYIEESLRRGTRWVVHEPNAEPLWARVRESVSQFMIHLYREGAFQGAKPDEAFFVRCDSRTTSAEDIAHGVLNIEVGFAPLKPAEFVVLRVDRRARPPAAGGGR